MTDMMETVVDGCIDNEIVVEDMVEVRLEAGKLRLREMMENGGRVVKKARKRTKKTTNLSKTENKGTIRQYLSNVVIRGEGMMMTEARKRKCDGLVEQESTTKRSKSSESPIPDDRGAKSSSKMEPRLQNVNKNSIDDDQIPREFQGKFTSEKTS